MVFEEDYLRHTAFGGLLNAIKTPYITIPNHPKKAVYKLHPRFVKIKMDSDWVHAVQYVNIHTNEIFIRFENDDDWNRFEQAATPTNGA